MNILVACEESQAVTIELRRLGHNAFSCDLIACSGGHPEWHIKQSVQPLLNGRCSFKTMDGTEHTVGDKWDMIIGFPPCTYLCVSGGRWFDVVKYGYNAQTRWNNRCIAICFFLSIMNADCERIAVENPVGVMSTYYRKPDQIIHPWQHGHPEQKKTCLWLKNLPLLKETDNVYEYMMTLPLKERTRIWQMGSGHSKERSKTYPGIAKAMAECWAGQAKMEG